MTDQTQRADLRQLITRAGEGLERRLRWIRRRGLGTVVREDARRATLETQRFLVGVTQDNRPNATPIYIVGLQRSGTSMLIQSLAKSPEVDVYHESPNSPAYLNWALRSDEVIRSLVLRSRHRAVLFKPLDDSLRIVHLIDTLGTPSQGRAVWLYRNVTAQIRSFFVMFGPGRAGKIGRELVDGHTDLEAAGLSEQTLEFLRHRDPAQITDGDGAALLWYVRNAAFFDLGLHARSDVRLVSYDQLVSEPARVMAPLCDFAGIRFRPQMVADIARRPPPMPDTPDVEPELAAACVELQHRLDAEFEQQAGAAS